MSAVRKPIDVIPIRTVEPAPDEPPFTPEEELPFPPFPGKYSHSEQELREMWSRIWRCFKNRRICEGFLHHNRMFELKVWAESFEFARQKFKDFEHIKYVIATANAYVKEGLPSEKLAKKLEEAEKFRQSAKYAVVDPGDPTTKVIEKRNKEIPLEDLAEHPMTLRFKNRNRG